MRPSSRPETAVVTLRSLLLLPSLDSFDGSKLCSSADIFCLTSLPEAVRVALSAAARLASTFLRGAVAVLREARETASLSLFLERPPRVSRREVSSRSPG